MIRQLYRGEPVEFMLRRLKKELGFEGKMRLYKRAEFFVPRSKRQASKSFAARKRKAA